MKMRELNFMNSKMQKLDKFLIKDLVNIINFYLTLRTIDIKNDTEILSIIKRLDILEDISEIYFKSKTIYNMYILIGITNKNFYFYISYSNKVKYNINIGQTLNEIIDIYLMESEIISFYEFQNILG
jgi:hypothetical protein